VKTLLAMKESLAQMEEKARVVGGIQRTENGSIDYSKDFFGKPAYLTVSGQLNGEYYACGLSNVYTFGPTFRAENSHTSRHLAEFWMIEPEMAFCTLQDDMQCAEDYVRFCCRHLLDTCRPDLEFITKMIDSEAINRLEQVASSPFMRLSYTDAVAKLEEVEKSGEKKFQFPVSWGIDLQSEHERYLTEEVYKQPVIVYDYPKEIKAFYMRLNDDNKTVAAMDVLVPRVGELIGGSQREDRFDVLEERIQASGMPLEPYASYLDLRKYGTVPHSGFGLGFERLILFATGIENIRDVIPFPRWPGNASF
jgi:asparaginyl-tRNA synthetase